MNPAALLEDICSRYDRQKADEAVCELAAFECLGESLLAVKEKTVELSDVLSGLSDRVHESIDAALREVLPDLDTDTRTELEEAVRAAIVETFDESEHGDVLKQIENEADTIEPGTLEDLRRHVATVGAFLDSQTQR